MRTKGELNMTDNIRNQSYFDGGLLALVGLSILVALVSIITLGLGAPWAMCRLYEWEIEHTVIEGRRLRFDGKAIELFGHWIKWLLLTIITLGIYGFWVNIRLKQWITKHTHFQ